MRFVRFRHTFLYNFSKHFVYSHAFNDIIYMCTRLCMRAYNRNKTTLGSKCVGVNCRTRARVARSRR